VYPPGATAASAAKEGTDMNWRHKIVLVMALTLFLATAITSQGSTSGVGANAGQSNVSATKRGMTDAITVALDNAKSRGLTHEPDAIYVIQGSYGDLQPNGSILRPFAHPNAMTPYEEKVYLVWIKAKFTLAGMSASVPVEHLFQYISINTGQPFEMMGGPDTVFGPPMLRDDMSLKPWTKVSTADIGKFPVPIWPAP
jgi:hypothetical protein